MNPRELFDILAKYERGELKVLGPWQPDTMPVAAPWHNGRVRRSPSGGHCLYTGRLGTEPMWGALLDELVEGEGGEAEADAWARANGYLLVDEEEECLLDPADDVSMDWTDDLDQDLLDDLVHDAASAAASNINNSGPQDQVAFLLEHGWTKDDIVQDATPNHEEE